MRRFASIRAASPHEGLIEFSMSLGRMKDAHAAAAGLLATHLNDARAHGYLARIAWLEQDAAGLQRELSWLRNNAAKDYAALEYERSLAMGRLRAAAAMRPVDAVTLALVGRLKDARVRAEQALRAWQADSASRPAPAVALLAVLLAGEDRWLKAAGESTRPLPNHVVLNDIGKPTMRAASQLSRGNGRAAVEVLEPARAYGFGLRNFGPTYLRGLGFLQARRGLEAAGEFERIIAHRGVDPRQRHVGARASWRCARTGPRRRQGRMPRRLRAFSRGLV